MCAGGGLHEGGQNVCVRRRRAPRRREDHHGGPQQHHTVTEGFQTSTTSRLLGEECCENLCSSTAQSAQGLSSSSAADLAHGLSSIGHERMKPIDHISRERPSEGAIGTGETTID